MTLHVDEAVKNINDRLRAWDTAIDKFMDVLVDYEPHVVTYWYSPGIFRTEHMSLVTRQGRMFSLWDEDRKLHRFLHVGDILEIK